MNSTPDRRISFFISGRGHDRAAMQPIADEAIERGYEVEFTENFDDDADIGVYGRCNKQGDTNLSIIMFHGIDDAYKSNYWTRGQNEDWSKFDVGLLPGRYSSEQWRQESYHPIANTRIGVFEVGWPKTDRVSSPQFEKSVAEYRNQYLDDSDRAVLYAPNGESPGQMQQFIGACENVADKLLIKHAPYEHLENVDGFETLSELYAEFEDREDIVILDPDDDIMVCLALSDIIVSDQSSVLNEAIVTDTIPVSVTDWQWGSEEVVSEKEFVIDFIITTEYKELESTIIGIYNDYEQKLGQLRSVRKKHYSHFEGSSEVILDLIDSIVEDRPLPLEPIDAKNKPLYRYYWACRTAVTGLMPASMKRLLMRLQLHRVEAEFRDLLSRLS